MGYTKKTGFMAGLTVAQISEFSLILIALGVKNGHLSPEILSTVTMIGLITIAGLTYAMLYAENIFRYISKFLSIFEKKTIMTLRTSNGRKNNEIILFGYDKIGYSLLKIFKKLRKKYLIIDYNPEVIKFLESTGVNCMYGDAEDSNTLNELYLSKYKMVISTIPIYEINSLILQHVRERSDQTIVILVSNSIEDSLKLYDDGASYVIIPRYLGGEHASALIERNEFNINKFINDKVMHLDHIGDRKVIKHFTK